MGKASGRKDPARESFEAGLKLVSRHPLIGPLVDRLRVLRYERNQAPPDGWAAVLENGELHPHPTRRGDPQEWARVLAHCALHFGFGHFRKRDVPEAWSAACCCAIERFLATLKLGRPPEQMLSPVDLPARTEEALYQEFRARGVPPELRNLHPGQPGSTDFWFVSGGPPRGYHVEDWQQTFARALSGAVADVIHEAAGTKRTPKTDTPGHKARNWFLNHYPLLGSLAVAFEIVEDPIVLARMQVQVGAVDVRSRELYLNSRILSAEECRFVMAHELLHVGLRHDARRQGRDPYLWKVACDYVINHWLVEMGLGELPSVGGLLDPELKGLSAEAIYDRIVGDLRRYRKLATLRGVGLEDLIDSGNPSWWSSRDGTNLDEFYRRCLSQGLEYHREQGRGLVPAGLIEEIRALMQPPIPWDVQLAQLFDRWFPPIEKRRSFARPSRRQSSTPDIARPAWVSPQIPGSARTFAVVLDSSASMDRALLARGLGAIASYALARDVPAVRVIFCDAMPFDEGYMPVESLAYGRVGVRGRGGTVLQPAIDLLESAADFPKDGPLLLITDGQCDRLQLRREHAFLIPEGASLPFAPKGPVFRMS